MRLAVNHPDLVSVKMALKNNTAKENLVCGICNEEAECPILSKCKHVFCREDARLFLESAPEDGIITCPVCFKPFSIDLSQQEVERLKVTGVQTSIVNHIDLTKWRSSTKIEGKFTHF
jgi:DNA repair protein RAD16